MTVDSSNGRRNDCEVFQLLNFLLLCSERRDGELVPRVCESMGFAKSATLDSPRIMGYDLRGHCVVKDHIHPSSMNFCNGSAPIVDISKVVV